MKKILPLILAALSATATVPQAQAGDQPFIGEVQWFAGNFAPRGWALCDGQLLPISSNTALFSILGTTYGGDGRTTFALPDVRGRVLIGTGQGPGLTNRPLGQKSGQENVTLTAQQIPAHSHPLTASSGAANATTPAGTVLASPGRTRIYDSGGPNVSMSTASIDPTGGGQAHPNMQPSLVLNCIIALQGIFPSRN
jgi:microcystin-dependent protein